MAIDWSAGFPRVVRSGLTQRDGQWFTAPDADNLYGNQVDDPYRQANFKDFQSAGLWNNLGDLDSSPFWQNYFGNIGNAGAVRDLLRSDPNKFAKTFYDLSGINPLTAGSEEINAIRSAGLTPAQLGELQGTAVARQQSAMDKDWDDYAHQAVEMGINIGAGALIGGGFSALGGSLMSGGAEAAGNASGGGTAATSAGTGAGEPGMWDWLDQFSNVPDDLGFDFPVDMPSSFNAGGMMPAPVAPSPEQLAEWGLTETGVGQFENLGNIESFGGSLGGSNFLPSGATNLLTDLAKKYLMNGGNASGGGTAQTTGGGILDLLRNNPLQAAFNSTPFLLALTEANRQSDDLNGVLSKINGDAYARSVVNPYDMDTAIGRTNLMQDQGLRGVRGSSFGNNDLTNYDYMRSLGRGDLISKANVATAGLEGNLINQRNTNRNLLLGAGLNASGRMFSPQTDPFGLESLRRMGLGL